MKHSKKRSLRQMILKKSLDLKKFKIFITSTLYINQVLSSSSSKNCVCNLFKCEIL